MSDCVAGSYSRNAAAMVRLNEGPAQTDGDNHTSWLAKMESSSGQQEHVDLEDGFGSFTSTTCTTGTTSTSTATNSPNLPEQRQSQSYSRKVEKHSILSRRLRKQAPSNDSEATKGSSSESQRGIISTSLDGAGAATRVHRRSFVDHANRKIVIVEEEPSSTFSLPRSPSIGGGSPVMAEGVGHSGMSLGSTSSSAVGGAPTHVVDGFETTATVSASATTSFGSYPSSSSIKLLSLYKNNHMRARFTIPFLILAIGTIASAAFVTVGITSEQSDSKLEFENHAAVYPSYFRDILDKYMVATMWAQSAAGYGDLTRERFTNIYNHMRSTGLDFQSIDYIPRVEHASRAQYEAESREYFAKYHPDYSYHGFVGKEPASPTNSTLLLSNRSQQEFYFVQHFVEPFKGNELSMDYDIYSSKSRRAAIDTALASFQPALSQVYGKYKNQMIMVNPGIEEDKSKLALTSILFRMDDLMTLAVKVQKLKEDIRVYLYDTSPGIEASRTFLGGIAVSHCNFTFLAQRRREGYDEDGDSRITADCCFIPNTPLAKATGSGRWQYVETIDAMSRNWTIVVTQESSLLQSQHWYIITGGAIIFFACACVALW